MTADFDNEVFVRGHKLKSPVRGVYALIEHNTVLYIGASKDIGRRLIGHKAKPYTHFLIKPLANKYRLRAVEQKLISKYRPPLNAACTYTMKYRGKKTKPRFLVYCLVREIKRAKELATKAGLRTYNQWVASVVRKALAA